MGFSAEAPHQHIDQRNIRQPRQGLIALDIAGVITLEFDQGDRLSRARQANPRGVGVAEIRPPIEAAGSRARVGLGQGGDPRRALELFSVKDPRSADPDQGAGPLEIIQAADMGKGNVQIEGGFVLGRVKRGTVHALVTA